MAKTDIAFHFNAPNKLAYTCKLLRKATLAGARVAVLGPPELLARLDLDLWAFSPQDFIAHARMPCSPEVQAHTPVLLCEDATAHADHGVLVNLGVPLPHGFEGFARLIEVVTHDEADRQA
ncbi:MAG: DNA polymerase III subunit chi, partial [Burkholderiaceae bacterium]